MLVADGKGDYAFLSLKGPAFDLTDRGVAGRAVTAGLDAFVYAERGVYRSGETVHLTTLLRDCAGRRRHRRADDAGDRAAGRRRVPPHRGAGSGARRALALLPDDLDRADRHLPRARLHRSEGSRPSAPTSFLVEDYVPDRMEFDLASPTGKLSKDDAGRDHARRPLPLRRAGLQPRSRRRDEGQGRRRRVPALPATSSAPMTTKRTSRASRPRSKTCRRPTTTARRRSPSRSTSCPAPRVRSKPQITVRLVESGGRAVERSITLPVVPSATMIGVKPLFSGKSLGEGENAGFDVIVVSPDGKQLAASGLRYELLKIERRYQYYRRDGRWEYEPVKSTRRMADGRIDVAADTAGPHLAARDLGPLSARCRERRSQHSADVGHVRRRLLRGCLGRHAGPARDRARQAGIRGRRHHDGRGDRAHGRQGHAQRGRRQAVHHHDDRRAGRHGAHSAHRRP